MNIYKLFKNESETRREPKGFFKNTFSEFNKYLINIKYLIIIIFQKLIIHYLQNIV